MIKILPYIIRLIELAILYFAISYLYKNVSGWLFMVLLVLIVVGYLLYLAAWYKEEEKGV